MYEEVSFNSFGALVCTECFCVAIAWPSNVDGKTEDCDPAGSRVISA